MIDGLFSVHSQTSTGSAAGTGEDRSSAHRCRHVPARRVGEQAQD